MSFPFVQHLTPCVVVHFILESTHFADFVAMPYLIESFRDGPPKLLESYLASGERWELLGSRADKLQTWHFSQYANAVFNEGRYPLDEFALAARYAHANVKFEEAFANAGKNGSVLLRNVPFFFCLNILAGWKEEAASIGMSLYRGLDSTLVGLRHTPEHQAGKVFRHLWFMLHLYCDARALPLDTSLYSYPEDMAPYAAVLSDWRTTDLTKVQSFVAAMADFHMAQARFTAHDEIAEFDIEDTMLFPYEILSFLRLREWAGLTNPTHFDHPLMNHPMARMPEPVPLPLPDTPLLDAVVAKFQLEYPGSFQN